MTDGNQFGTLISIHVGQPQDIGIGEAAWRTGFYKTQVCGSVQIARDGIAGDGQADTKHHGGVDKAVLAYSANHQAYWRQELCSDVMGGGFGENLFLADWDEELVCIGDMFQLGSVLLEVTQPRQPCWKLGRRWSRKDLPKIVVQNGRSGWYLRVKEAGVTQHGDACCLLDRRHESWTVAQANRVYYGDDATAKCELAQLPELSDAWRADLRPKPD